MVVVRVLIRVLLFFALLAAPVAAQGLQDNPKLPSGKSQRDEILKADHQKNLDDSARIRELARDLETELKEDGFAVLSRDALQKTEEIEKLAKRIRKRLRRT